MPLAESEAWSALHHAHTAEVKVRKRWQCGSRMAESCERAVQGFQASQALNGFGDAAHAQPPPPPPPPKTWAQVRYGCLPAMLEPLQWPEQLASEPPMKAWSTLLCAEVLPRGSTISVQREAQLAQRCKGLSSDSAVAYAERV